MTRSKRPKWVWNMGIGLGLVTMFLATHFTRHQFYNYYLAELLFVLPLIPAALLALYIKLRTSRTIFLSWLSQNTVGGRSHFCLNCWQPLPNMEAKQCAHCSEQVYSFATGLPGRPLMSPDDEDAAREMPAVELPSQSEREIIAHFMQNKEHPHAGNWGCLLQILACLNVAGVVSLIATAYSGGWHWVLALLIEIGLVILTVWAAGKSMMFLHFRIRKKVRKYCPDGVVPWCIYCDYDLRGSAKPACPECGQPVFVYDFKWRPWKKKRSRPER